LKQFVKQGAIVDHRPPQVFGAGLSATVAQRNVVRRTIVLYDHRMIDGNVRGALIEVRDRISASLHHFVYKLIGPRNRTLRIIDKLSLHRHPTAREIRAHGRSQGANLKFLDSGRAYLEDALRAPNLTLFLDDPVVFRAKAFAQPLTSSFSR
jgi:hypothetical protein